jgi:peptidoglycan hydrolase-like protein with peptidoglycan-binding domain
MATDMADTSADTAAALAADSELSIDVLRAMQGALSRGQKRSLQQHLRNLGYYRGLIDGIFGPQTARAISAYQVSIGASETGVLTPVQLEALSE